MKLILLYVFCLASLIGDVPKEIQAKLITDMRNQINGLLADFTKKDIEQISIDTDRDFWMTAQEALEYGIVDEVLTQRELADKK